jgi:hypothetical protein
LPDFDAIFIINCDASSTGFGVVLHQGSGPIAFYSCPIAPQHAKLIAYERELNGFVKAVRRWRPYLWARPFVVRTDHYALKFLLDQHLSTIPQHAWVSKLFGYDSSVEYLPGKVNTVADALPRRDEDCAMALVLSSPTFTLFNDLRREMTELEDDIRLLEMIRKGEAADMWLVINGLAIYSGRIYMSTTSSL